MTRPLLAVACCLGVTWSSAGVAHALTVPNLSAVASGDGQAGTAQPRDVANLSGSAAATGSLTFRLFGPDDAMCSREPAQTATVAVAGDGVYEGNGFYTLSNPGTYRFVVTYSGDAQNNPVSTSCGDPNQVVAISKATPHLIATASPSVPAGQTIADAARLVDAVFPSGVIVFELYGPDDATCASSIATSTGTLADENSRASSAPYTTAFPGVYRWIARYPGDARNAATAGGCGDTSQSVTVTSPALGPAGDPRVALEPTPPILVGASFAATVGVTTTSRPEGTLTFRLFGPDDPTCARGAVAAGVSNVLGSGRYSSAPFTPGAPGTYIVVASFVGDDGKTATTSCADAAGRVIVAALPGPEPQLSESFNVDRVDGRVFVRLPTTAARAFRALKFVEVRETRNVPFGTVVNTRKGTAKLTLAVTAVRRQTGNFNGTTFTVRQPAGGGGVTEIDIRDSAANRTVCRLRRTRASAAAVAPAAKRTSAARRKKLPRTVIATLKARAKGKYRTRGRNSSASVVGTTWDTVERCDGTRTLVKAGVVKVFDRRSGVTKTVRAGRSLLVPERP